ncbi:catechol 2,3-dioxygenase-like lactoylglutathione lyase family enzyme [Saccharopolyspora lacisalsi]|uniref:Catechol 2,3-dioxygenase-like lactoylglutathione lyase family enzyme n=1 Tax=Halosaccharopolyspora lacisalsi TaxID=1000566 RepID=A0A839DRG6_9PSEU|nr:VOC family protein [Halosaccharopolyspora lacisalsi]MBA8822876.1 catechol 2,3-dioxygenase-like lactoylglutathione lyase family enzyme [Halosaccharopolyspora lacisalsi]
MTTLFNHTIIAAHDKQRSASFFTEMFGLPPAEPGGVFLVVHLDGGVLLQFAEPGIDFPPQHYAFLVTEDDFDGIHGRIRTAGVEHWADPHGKLPQQYNTNHGGRGVYFCDPSGHYLEAITRPYGSDPG